MIFFTNGEYLFNVRAYDNSISAYKKFINLDLIDIYDIYWHYTGVPSSYF